jgi:hypothetical protein
MIRICGSIGLKKNVETVDQDLGVLHPELGATETAIGPDQRHGLHHDDVVTRHRQAGRQIIDRFLDERLEATLDDSFGSLS